jgi:hypothetical protein
MKKSFGLRKLTRHLLATSCLTVAAGAAHASTVFGPFGSSFATATALPVGTTEIQDTVTTGGFDNVSEWAEFSGLPDGGTFSFSATEVLNGNTVSGSVSVRNSSDTDLLDFSIPASAQTGAVPSDGVLYVDVQFGTCGSDCAPSSYTIDLSAAPSSVPEPGTLAAAGLALVGAVALRRKRK